METVKMQNDTEIAVNYIFYVSDYFDVSSGHVWKMDAKQAMIDEMQKNLPNCKVQKYTEYHGECLDGSSVGIVFPSHMWGISLAVYSFLQNLRVGKDTYVYAVAIGEVLSGDVDGTANLRVKTLQQFRDIFEKRKLGTIADIYIRCIDYRRELTTTEEKLMRAVQIDERIRDVMEGILFYRISDVQHEKLRSISEKEPVVEIYEKKESDRKTSEKKDSETKVVSMPVIRNLFLDDELLSEVRICQAM